MDDGELERKAVEELLKEANRAKIRAETMGPAGWMKCPLGSTNKRFLLNTLRSSALERPSEKERDKHRYKRTTDYEKSPLKNHSSHRSSHSSSKRHSPYRSSSSSHSPSKARKSNRKRSRSPVRDGSSSSKKNK